MQTNSTTIQCNPSPKIKQISIHFLVAVLCVISADKNLQFIANAIITCACQPSEGDSRIIVSFYFNTNETKQCKQNMQLQAAPLPRRAQLVHRA